jgi:hypothetical protein
LLDRGYSHDEIDAAMNFIVGIDFLKINVSTWIDRMIAAGSVEMEHSLEFDEPPVIDIIESEIIAYLSREREERWIDHEIDKGF